MIFNIADNVNLFFSDFFDVPAAKVKEYGALNVSLISDLPLFIDPFLLFNSRKEAYRDLHDRIVRYVSFLRTKSVDHALEPNLIRAWYTFPEVRQTWLGFTKTGNEGRGLGIKFAGALHRNLSKVFGDFGKEKITKGSHLEKLCLIEEGVGRDNISDFVTNLIKEYLLDYTRDFASRHIDSSRCREFAVNNVSFNYETESWESRIYSLPHFKGDFVLLTPKDMLTKDDTWINRADFIQEFSAIPDSISDGQLRALIDNFFKSRLPKIPTAKDVQQAAIETIIHFPELADYYIRLKEDTGSDAVSSSAEKVRTSEQLYVTQFSQLASLLHNSTSFYQLLGETCKEARERVLFLKDVIENKGGHKLFYVNGHPLEREEDLHIAYRLTWYGTPSDVSREVNDGRGPADFKVSRGAKDKAIVEFKLASNSHLKKNLKNQAEIYQKASDAQCSIKVIVFFFKEQLDRVTSILTELGLNDDQNVVLIDARADNKPSASKAS